MNRITKSLLFRFMDTKLSRLLPDKQYISSRYKAYCGKKLNLKNPITFNEKLQWLKLNGRKPEYTIMADKYEVRQYVAEKIGEEYLIPIVGVWDKFEDIDFDKIPNQFVLKPNHTSGNVFICTDKYKVDYKALKKEVDKWMKREYYWVHREWPYKNIKPRIIAEKYIADELEEELKDYKFMCFNGEPKIIQVMSERKYGKYLLNHFNLDWKEINIPRKSVKKNTNIPNRPNNLAKMTEISKQLSKDYPFVRIDLYETQNGVYFGEITFYPMSGYMDFTREDDDILLGNWIKLPVKDNS